MRDCASSTLSLFAARGPDFGWECARSALEICVNPGARYYLNFYISSDVRRCGCLRVQVVVCARLCFMYK